MAKIDIITNNPVPSCTIKEFIWSDEIGWKFRYEATIPDNVKIDENGIFSKELYLYGHIQQLYLVNIVTNNSVNLKIKSKDELVQIVNEQFEEDMKYRRKWINENPDYYDNVYTITIPNKTQKPLYDHIIFIKEQKEHETIFVVAPKKGV